jgi:hypothetical protein
MLALVVAGALALSGSAAPQSTCQLEAHPPFLYAGMVFGSGRVACSAPSNKISITVALERDGVEAARVVRNDCRKVSVCWNTTANALDQPGDQIWCSHVWGAATGSDLGELVACEEQEF